MIQSINYFFITTQGYTVDLHTVNHPVSGYSHGRDQVVCITKFDRSACAIYTTVFAVKEGHVVSSSLINSPCFWIL